MRQVANDDHHTSAIGLFVLYESFPQLTAGLRGCTVFSKRHHLTRTYFTSHHWCLHWLVCLYMIHIDKLSHFHHKSRIKLMTIRLSCQCSDHQATTSPHIHSPLCFIMLHHPWGEPEWVAKGPVGVGNHVCNLTMQLFVQQEQLLWLHGQNFWGKPEQAPH